MMWRGLNLGRPPSLSPRHSSAPLLVCNWAGIPKRDGALASEDNESKSLDAPENAPSKADVLDAVEKLDPSDKMAFVSEMLTMISVQGPAPNPIAAKVDETHITAAIEAAREHDERLYHLHMQRENRKDSNRWFLLSIFLVVIVAVAAACWAFKDNTAILLPLLTGLFGVAMGGFGGYGMGKAAG